MEFYDRTQAQNKIGIGKTQYYEYLKALKIKPEQRDGMHCITQAELEAMLEHRNTLHPAESMPEIVIETSEHTAESTAEPIPEQTAIATIDLGEITPQSLESLDLNKAEDLRALVRIAQARKAKQIMQPELVLAHLIEQLSEEDLEEDLQQEIKQTREAINSPLANPAAIASQILSKYRSGN
jgi:hypothetical protein